jgi:hypothetical protein
MHFCYGCFAESSAAESIMRHELRRLAPSSRFICKFASVAGIASLGTGVCLVALLSPSRPASADVVWAKKDCVTTPCTITTGGSPPPALAPGQFRVIGQPINWSATYQATPQRFWVGKTGMNVADQQLTAFNGELGGNFNLPLGLWYISVKTGNMGWGTYTVFGPNVLGDPHITAMDGTRFDFQGAGEFVMLKSRAAGLEVQSRMTPVSTVAPLPPDAHTGLSSCPSINTAAAIRSPRHRFSYQPSRIGTSKSAKMQLRIDGHLSSVPGGSLTLDDGTRVTLNHASSELRIALRNGWSVRIVPTWWSATGRWYLDFDFTLATSAVGVAGPLARGSWLPALSDGSSVGAIPAATQDRYKVLYETFANSWRVDAASSLFDYSPGQSTATFTNGAWPGRSGKCRLPNTTPLAQLSEIQAAKICAGVISAFKKACIADVMGTGDRIFAAGYAKTQGPARYKTTVPDMKAQQRD